MFYLFNLNVIFSRQPFKRIFLTFQHSTDYNKNSLKILNLKWRFFERRDMEKIFNKG